MTEENKTPNELSHDVEVLKHVFSEGELKMIDLYEDGVKPAIAHQLAGLSKKPDENAAMRILEAPTTQRYIQALRRQVACRSIMTLEKIDQRMSDIAMTDVTDVVELGELFYPTGPEGSTSAPVQTISLKDLSKLTPSQRAAIKKIKPCTGGVEIELHDKVKVMEILAKRRGGFTEKQEVTHSGNVEVFAYTGFNNRGPKD